MPFENMCPCGGILALFVTLRLFSGVDSHVDSKPASLIDDDDDDDDRNIYLRNKYL